ncbi:MAG TPA: hypothetical protein VK467_04550 [Gemmatimonadales bacterium]|nr:hypothetical protein [Gemmatimonadales bacterium]
MLDRRDPAHQVPWPNGRRLEDPSRVIRLPIAWDPAPSREPWATRLVRLRLIYDRSEEPSGVE